MRGRVVLIALGVAALAAPSANAAGRNSNQRLRAKVARQQRLLVAAEATIKSSRAQVAGLKSQVASFQSQVASFRSRTASLEAELGQRTTERNSARAQVASLQAQLAAIPTPMTVAVEQVQREVAAAEHGTAGTGWAAHAPSSYSTGMLTALSAMNYVVGHVSASALVFDEYSGLPIPAATPDAVLEAQAGFCGDAALTFAAIVERFGYDARSVQFYWQTPNGQADSHIAVEVYYDDAWHFFDPTFGAFWTDPVGGGVLSATDARSGGGVEHRDAAAFTDLIEEPWSENGDSVSFELDPATVVDIGAQPFPDEGLGRP